MKPSQILTQARTLISEPKHWTKGQFARDIDGEQTLARHPDACSWCSLGALIHVEGRLSPGEITLDELMPKAIAHLQRALLQLHGSDPAIAACDLQVHRFNDQRTHAEVLQMFDLAIELATEQGD